MNTPGVKICGLTRPEDARAAVQAGARAIGMVFAPSPRRVTLSQARRIAAAVPAHVLRVGVFVDQDPEWVAASAQKIGLDRFQFHGSETSAYLRHFPEFRIIRALKPGPAAPQPDRDPAPAAAAFLVDALVAGIAGGTGRTSNWDYARSLRRWGKTLILSGGLTANNVQAAIRCVQPDMVDVSSGVETAPGIKSPAKIRAFLRAVISAI